MPIASDIEIIDISGVSSPISSKIKTRKCIDLSSPSSTKFKVEDIKITSPSFAEFLNKWKAPITKPPANVAIRVKSEEESGEDEFLPTIEPLPDIFDSTSVPRYVSKTLGRPLKRPRTKPESFEEISVSIGARVALEFPCLQSFLQKNDWSYRIDYSSEDLILWERTRWNSPSEKFLSPFILKLEKVSEMSCSRYNHEYFHTLTGHQATLHPSQIYVIFFGMKAVHQKSLSEVNKRFRQAVAAGEKYSNSLPSLNDVKHEIFLRATNSGVHVLFVENDADLTLQLLDLTKAISWEPYHDGGTGDSFSFCTRSSSFRSGNDLRETWKLILQEIPMVSMQIADAIATHVPSIHDLYQLYTDPRRSKSDCELALANIPVGNQRHLGPALSKKIYRVFTSKEGNFLLTAF